MSETWKKNFRRAFRFAEFMLAAALLAVLFELTLIILNTPGPVPEIRVIRTTQRQEPPPVLVPAQMPAAQNQAKPPQPVAKPQPLPHKPVPPALLDFENLRRLLAGVMQQLGKGSTVTGHSSGGGNSGPSGSISTTPPQMAYVTTPVFVPATNNVPQTNNPTAGTNNMNDATQPDETNRVVTASTTAANNSEVFRIAVP